MAEFRVVEEFASKLFTADEGKRLGTSVRKVEISTDDPRFQQIGDLQRQTKATSGRSFFHGWVLRRTYEKTELAAASIFRFSAAVVFEPAGEERGTKYDESSACPRCGSGAKQIGSLVLDLMRIPKGKDIARTIAGEIVVSRKVAELFARSAITGVEFGPVRMTAASSAESKDWFQLVLPVTGVEMVAPTRVGIDPFNDDLTGECRCPVGDLIGLNLLSEVTVSASTRGDSDFVSSRQFIGVRRGLLRPERVILISPKVWRLIESERIKGIDVEVAHLA